MSECHGFKKRPVNINCPLKRPRAPIRGFKEPKKLKRTAKEKELMEYFALVINSAPNIEEMLKDPRFDYNLMHDLYKSWMKSHYPTMRRLNIDDFLDEFGIAVDKLGV